MALCDEGEQWKKLALELLNDVRNLQDELAAWKQMIERQIWYQQGFTDQDIEDLQKLPITSEKDLI